MPTKKRKASKRIKSPSSRSKTLIKSFRGHTGTIGRISWSPDGLLLASGASDKTVRVWSVATGKTIHRLKGHNELIYSVTFSNDGRKLASASDDGTVHIWDVQTGRLSQVLRGPERAIGTVVFAKNDTIIIAGGSTPELTCWNLASGDVIRQITLGERGSIYCVALDSDSKHLAVGTGDGLPSIAIIDISSFTQVQHLEGHRRGTYSLAFDPHSDTLASCGGDRTIKLWSVHSGKQTRILEGHTSTVAALSFSLDGRLLGSRALDGTVKVWRTEDWIPVAHFRERSTAGLFKGFAFHPFKPHLALTTAQGSANGKDKVIHLWELNDSRLLGASTRPTVTYTTSKIVLVGESGVGKTGLGWRIAHGAFKEHASTHGQQFWVLEDLSTTRADGAQCEAVLWDLAGQPDYRLIHALFLDDADVALVLFDPTRAEDPLHGVEFWLKQLAGSQQSSKPTIILVAARSDRGTPRLTEEEIKAYCESRGVVGYVCTSASNGEGIDELVDKMQRAVPWDDKPATVTTETFKRVKDFVLGLKENRRRKKTLFTPNELKMRIEKDSPKWRFSLESMLTAIGHLANHGYVTKLRTSKGELRILLAPEILNNLAASFVLEARRQQKGLGSLEEDRLLAGKYTFPELEDLSNEEQEVLLDSAAALFLEHNVCFRETDPLSGKAYLVFPELINMQKPATGDNVVVEDGVAYTVSGAVENVYASLVVLLGYTHTFTRTSQWRNQARYEVGDKLVCGFRLEAEREGELDFVLYFGTRVSQPVRTLFQGLFESFLGRRNVNVLRYEPVTCSKGHQINRAVVREQMNAGQSFAHCGKCGLKVWISNPDKAIQLSTEVAANVERQRRAADQRSRFEQVIFRLKTYATERAITPPDCFISYAWGNNEHERWVEKNLATDLVKAGIDVILDKWENAKIGASVPRFVSRVAKADRVIVVGTANYRRKYQNDESMRGFVVAAEGDLIGVRLIGTEKQKQTVLPLLIEGTDNTSFPDLLLGRVYADFRDKEKYFGTALDLMLSLYDLPHQHPVSVELRESLQTIEALNPPKTLNVKNRAAPRRR